MPKRIYDYKPTEHEKLAFKQKRKEEKHAIRWTIIGMVIIWGSVILFL